MPALIIAILVLIAVSFFSVSIRAIMMSTLLLTGIALLIIPQYRVFGTAVTAISLILLYFSSLSTPPAKRIQRMGVEFLYGVLMIAKIAFYMLIITIPLAKYIAKGAESWHEAIVVDEFGSAIRKEMINQDFKDARGRKYEQWDQNGMY